MEHDEVEDVPGRLLGLSYETWTSADLRVVLNHYGVATPANVDKMPLMQELDTLTTQRGLTVADRRAILRSHRARAPLPVSGQIIPSAPDNTSQPVAPRQYNHRYTRTRWQQRQDYHVHRRRDRTGRFVRKLPRRQEDRTSAEAATNFSPNVRNPRRTWQTIHNRPVHTDSNQTENVQPSQRNDISVIATSPEPLQDTTDTSGNRISCLVCFETLGQEDFPRRQITASCDHNVDICSGCLSQSITVQLREKSWKQIDCPICHARLGFDDVKEFANGETFER